MEGLERTVIAANAGIHCLRVAGTPGRWIPAFAGMTDSREDFPERAIMPRRHVPSMTARRSSRRVAIGVVVG